MAIGDAVTTVVSISSMATLTIQPDSEDEWIIHNIYHTSAADLYIVEGSDEILFDDDTSGGAWLGYWFHLTNSHYLKVKNNITTTALLGYDGIVSK